MNFCNKLSRYAREGIQWQPIKFFNNRIVVDLIDSAKPPGIFSILNDVCATMHAVNEGADAMFVDKVKGAVAGHPHFTASTGQFCVKHYAGDVTCAPLLRTVLVRRVTAPA